MKQKVNMEKKKTKMGKKSWVDYGRLKSIN